MFRSLDVITKIIAIFLVVITITVLIVTSYTLIRKQTVSYSWEVMWPLGEQERHFLILREIVHRIALGDSISERDYQQRRGIVLSRAELIRVFAENNPTFSDEQQTLLRRLQQVMDVYVSIDRDRLPDPETARRLLPLLDEAVTISHDLLNFRRDIVFAAYREVLGIINRLVINQAITLITLFLVGGWFLRAASVKRRAAEEVAQQLRANLLQAEDLAIEQERVRVAREIHDGLGHHLNNVKVHVGVAYRAFEADPPVALDSLTIAKTEIHSAQRELRHAIDALVSNDHLAGSLEELLSEPIRDCQLAGINVDFEVIGTPRSPSEQIKHVLYRIGQEALNNIRQHASAKRASFQIHYQEQQIQILVEDDGVGLSGSVERRRGHGLDNLQERAALVGGKTVIETRPGQGVRVIVEVPYEPHKGLDRR